MRAILGATALLTLIAGGALAQSIETLTLLEEAAATCAEFEDGVFEPADAVTPIELTSQFGSVAAEIVDESKFQCSSAASMYCGSGGCALHLVADGTVSTWQATGWRMLDWGPDSILLIGRDGGWCGGSGAEVCYEAIVWSDGRVLTVGPAPVAGE